MDYRQAGVDIDAGNEVVRRIRSLARATFTPGVLSEIGSFGGLFRLGAAGVDDPVLVASADGVGTKLRVAFMTGVHGTIGVDLVNHCVNDILVQGAEPLFFLDYLATGRLEPDVAVQIVEGLAAACRENGCALLGGETAEMPGFYPDGEYDVAGFIVGVVPRDAAHRRARRAAGRRADRRCPRPGCTPTATRWRGASCSRWPGSRHDVGRSGARHDRSARRCSCRTARTCRSIRPLLGAGRDQGHGAHHRRRDHRQPAAGAADGHVRGDRSLGLDAAAGLRVAAAGRRGAGRRHVAHLQHGHRADRRDAPRRMPTPCRVRCARRASRRRAGSGGSRPAAKGCATSATEAADRRPAARSSAC